MTDQTPLQKQLRKIYGELKSRNSSYSLRAFARKLGMNSGVLSAIMSGKRRISRKAAIKIAHALALDPQERAEFLSCFQPSLRKAGTRPPGLSEDSSGPQYIQLSPEQYQSISEWHHFGLLNLLRTQGFKNDPKWIAQRLGLTTAQIKAAIRNLKAIGILEETQLGELRRTAPAFRTTDDIPSETIRAGHARNLELARLSLDRDELGTRDFSAITLAIDPSKLQEAKALIRKFQDDLSALVECEPQTEVYKLCVQFFPLTVPRKESP